ncbi:Cna B-type domain-containing protein [Fenollaria massiliensis]|uniref:Cna B-type domain-containing protein n=1 Tax=Fenollaria massiliensis TaxID=938288 RepID=UPI00035FA781|nr:Cna B-type domain-containing protein [Fenollaria massiliensis]
MPNDSDDMERRQELVKEAEAKGEKALEDTDLEKNPLPNVKVILKRAETFLATLFKVEKGATLTLGKDNKDPLFIDGNKDVKTNLKASFIEVNGELIMNGGFIANGNNECANSAPIYVHDKATFTMNGGRITSNKNICYERNKDGSWLGEYFATGGVYIEEGGSYTLNAGSIDNNVATVGGVFLGNLNTDKINHKEKAKFTMNGGLIANNKLVEVDGFVIKNYGGAVHVDSNSEFILENGILAGNASYHGGAVAVNDNYNNGYSYKKYANTNTDLYENYVKYAGAYYTQKGGLIYKNIAKLKGNDMFTGAGGGLYINSSTAELKGGYILNNKSDHEGGGIYLSLTPCKLTLKNTLITKNRAVNNNKTLNLLSPGEGGGYWNCPEGDDIIEDYHSLYIFENEALYNGADIHTGYKADDFKLNGVDKKFISRISPITEYGNIIKYIDDIKNEDPKWMYNTNEAINIKAQYDAKTKNEAWTNSSLFIMGNESDRGAGIGSNADIYSPGKPKNNKVIIEKKWDKSVPEDKIPKSIWVDLYIGDKKYAEVELSKKNNWIYMFENLPFTSEELAAKGLKYKLKERSDDFYSVIEESDKTFLEVERIWANYSSTIDPKPNDANHSEKIIFVYKDKNGKEIKREDIGISNLKKDGKKWTGLLNNDLFAGLKNLDNVTITYHSFYKPYKWQGYYGLDGNSDWDGSGPWHEAYVLEKADGRIEIQLPYIWTQYLNGVGRTQDSSKNKSGYRLNLVTNHTLTLTNYPYSEIPVEKNWDETVKKEDIPDSVNVYLLKDGKRFIDRNGKDRVITLSKANGWKGKFEKLPYFELEGMGFEHYWVKEDSEIFIPLVKVKGKPYIDVFVERIQELANGYKINDEDYAGGVYRIEYIPVEVHHGNKVDKFNLTFHPKDPQVLILGGPVTGEKKFLADLKIPEDKNIVIKTYYDKDGKPFPRNLGKFEANWEKQYNKGAYTLKLVEENGKLVLYVPKLTPKNMDENLLDVKARVVGNQPYFELTNYYLPKHRIEVEKVWDTENTESIPKNLKIKIKGKYVDKEITLTPENWKYFEEFLGKGVLSTNNYEFTEEELANFNGSQAIETTMEFEAKDKTVKFYDADKKEITKDEFLGLIKGKKYSFELKEAVEDKAEVEIKYDADGNMVIVYPVDVVITEVAQVKFTNTEIPPEPPTPRKTFVRVRKVWQALGETKDIKVELYINGEASGKFLTLNEANDWSASFTNLDIEDDMGNQYIYTVKEVGEKDKIYTIDERKFEVSYSGDMYDGFTILNKEVPPEEPPTPEEPPENPEEPEPEPPTPPTPPTPPEEHIIPKTGVSEDVLGIFLALMILIGLVFIKKKYILKKSK